MEPADLRVLRAIGAAVAEVTRLRGAVFLSRPYLRAIERVEALPENQSGADRTWLWKAVERDRRHFAGAVRR
jgi:hypothetical protein